MAYTQKQGRDPLPKTGNGITDALLKGAGAIGAKSSTSNDSIPSTSNDSIPSAKYNMPVPSKKTKVSSSFKPTNSMRYPSMVKTYPSKKEGKLKRAHTGIKTSSKKL